MLLEFCSEHQLVITSTLFQQDRFKATWRHLRSKHWHLLDYVLTGQCDMRDVLHKKATKQLKVGKPPGTDGIPAEVCQHGEEAVLDKLQDLFTNCWEKGTLLQDLRDAFIVPLYKIREKNQTVHIIEASLCSLLQAKHWLASC